MNWIVWIVEHWYIFGIVIAGILTVIKALWEGKESIDELFTEVLALLAGLFTGKLEEVTRELMEEIVDYFYDKLPGWVQLIFRREWVYQKAWELWEKFLDSIRDEAEFVGYLLAYKM